MYRLLISFLFIPMLLLAMEKPKYVKVNNKIISVIVGKDTLSYGMEGFDKYIGKRARVNKELSIQETIKRCSGKWIESKGKHITLHDFSNFDWVVVDYILRDHILKWGRKVRIVPCRN